MRRERPKRIRVPVDRLTYQAPLQSRNNSSSRRDTIELRNLDQYSTDDEFTASNDNRTTRRKRRYNMRENRRKINRFVEEFSAKQPHATRGFNDDLMMNKHR